MIPWWIALLIGLGGVFLGALLTARFLPMKESEAVNWAEIRAFCREYAKAPEGSRWQSILAYYRAKAYAERNDGNGV